MNKAFVIIGIPAFITSFLYLTFGWGLKVSIPVTALELVLGVGWYAYLSRNDKPRQPKVPAPPSA
jgi:membrane protein implicated in regulation of membrane protease activity